MKNLDVIVAVLLVVGGANWGLHGVFGLNLVEALFGNANLITTSIYTLVGLSALYQALSWKAIQKRWCETN